MAARATREEWSKRVERWRESGLTAQEFAAELGVNPRTLTHWKWALTKGPATRSKTSASAVPFVEVGQTPARADVFELELSGGAIIPHAALADLRVRFPYRLSLRTTGPGRFSCLGRSL